MPQQPLSNIKALTVMHFSLLVGQLMFAGIAAYLVYTKSFGAVVNNEEVISILGPGLTGFAGAFVLIAFYSYNRKLEKISTHEKGIQEINRLPGCKYYPLGNIGSAHFISHYLFFINRQNIFYSCCGSIAILVYIYKTQYSKSRKRVGY